VALARAGNARDAARMTAALCADWEWPTAVPPVLLLAPTAFTALANTLSRYHPPSGEQ
jgi:hypothetical protein